MLLLFENYIFYIIIVIIIFGIYLFNSYIINMERDFNNKLKMIQEKYDNIILDITHKLKTLYISQQHTIDKKNEILKNNIDNRFEILSNKMNKINKFFDNEIKKIHESITKQDILITKINDNNKENNIQKENFLYEQINVLLNERMEKIISRLKNIENDVSECYIQDTSIQTKINDIYEKYNSLQSNQTYQDNNQSAEFEDKITNNYNMLFQWINTIQSNINFFTMDMFKFKKITIHQLNNIINKKTIEDLFNRYFYSKMKKVILSMNHIYSSLTNMEIKLFDKPNVKIEILLLFLQQKINTEYNVNNSKYKKTFDEFTLLRDYYNNMYKKNPNILLIWDRFDNSFTEEENQSILSLKPIE
jgi:hypothetical protein